MYMQLKRVFWLLASLGVGLALIAATVDVSGLQSRAEASAALDTAVYLPISVNDFPLRTSLGAQVSVLDDTVINSRAVEAGLSWARMDIFHWAEIEPQNTNASGYKWSDVDEASLITAYENGINVIGIIRTTPSWAQKIAPYSCGAISQAAMPEFANFVHELVKRYSTPPFNVKYWEIWNEPDVVYSPELGYDSVFGCWGDASQTYYGGVYYGEMLNMVYPAMKSANPKVQVGIGGLLIDCDPTFDKNCHSGKFLEGVVRSGKPGRGDNFDFVGYHGYALYAGTGGGLSQDEHNPKWAHRGGVVLGKLDFIRFILGKYGVDKPIFHTEGALICPEDKPFCNPPGGDFEQAQADYVVWLFIRNWANNIDATIWYQLNGLGWRYGGLLDGSQNPKPAFNALKYLAQELHGASYNGRVLESTPVAGYEFLKKGKKVWVLWSPDELPHTVSLPGSAKKAFDKYGVEIAIGGGNISVSHPVYIELSP